MTNILITFQVNYLLYEDGSKITDKIEITLENLDDPSLGQKITRSVNGHYQFACPIVQ